MSDTEALEASDNAIQKKENCFKNGLCFAFVTFLILIFTFAVLSLIYIQQNATNHQQMASNCNITFVRHAEYTLDCKHCNDEPTMLVTWSVEYFNSIFNSTLSGQIAEIFTDINEGLHAIETRNIGTTLTCYYDKTNLFMTWTVYFSNMNLLFGACIIIGCILVASVIFLFVTIIIFATPYCLLKKSDN